ncbi:MAG: cupin domain-containing protein [Bauldia sp.]
MKAEPHFFADDGDIPNNRLPLILYAGALAPTADTAAAFEALFRANNWGDGWRYTVYPFHHYHSNVHEALGVAAGTAELRFGGEANGRMVQVKPGDAVLIPAGVGHKRVSSSNDFLVVGAYALGANPAGTDRDLFREGAEDTARIRARIVQVARPATDPVTGASGGLHELWR